MHKLVAFFLPKETRFFDMLSEQSETVLKTSKEFHQFLKNYNTLSSQSRVRIIRKIGRLEIAGDRQSGEIIELLNNSLVTPYDREDIHSLTVLLDDILDLLDQAARKMLLYKMDSLPIAASKQADSLLELARVTHAAINRLHKLQEVKKHCAELYALENKGDSLYEDAISQLFEGFSSNNNSVLDVIKFKELFEDLENVFDKGKDLADAIQAIVVKHG